MNYRDINGDLRNSEPAATALDLIWDKATQEAKTEADLRAIEAITEDHMSITGVFKTEQNGVDVWLPIKGKQEAINKIAENPEDPSAVFLGDNVDDIRRELEQWYREPVFTPKELGEDSYNRGRSRSDAMFVKLPWAVHEISADIEKKEYTEWGYTQKRDEATLPQSEVLKVLEDCKQHGDQILHLQNFSHGKYHRYGTTFLDELQLWEHGLTIVDEGDTLVDNYERVIKVRYSPETKELAKKERQRRRRSELYYLRKARNKKEGKQNVPKGLRIVPTRVIYSAINSILKEHESRQQARDSRSGENGYYAGYKHWQDPLSSMVSHEGGKRGFITACRHLERVVAYDEAVVRGGGALASRKDGRELVEHALRCFKVYEAKGKPKTMSEEVERVYLRVFMPLIKRQQKLINRNERQQPRHNQLLKTFVNISGQRAAKEKE